MSRRMHLIVQVLLPLAVSCQQDLCMQCIRNLNALLKASQNAIKYSNERNISLSAADVLLLYASMVFVKIRMYAEYLRLKVENCYPVSFVDCTTD